MRILIISLIVIISGISIYNINSSIPKFSDKMDEVICLEVLI